MRKPYSFSGFSTCKLAAIVFSLLALTACAPVQGADNRAPDVPAILEVPDGNRVAFHVFAEGVQIYVWTSSSWMFQAPEAELFAGSDGGVVGTHYGGPTWKSNSGSTVVGQRLAGSTVDPTAIPWLLLQAKTTAGPGIFERTTYVQRVNTMGGLAPADPGTATGQEARVPYMAEYYFYRAES
jgi:hypothetical protein